MLIDETLYPVETAWEGELVPPSGVFAARGKTMPKVSIGKPDWWAGQKILGDAWKAPEGGYSYGLARFRFLSSARRQAGGEKDGAGGGPAARRWRCETHSLRP